VTQHCRQDKMSSKHKWKVWSMFSSWCKLQKWFQKVSTNINVAEIVGRMECSSSYFTLLKMFESVLTSCLENILRGIYFTSPCVFPFIYRKDRLNNSVFLSLSLCTKRSILFGRGNSTDAVLKRTPSSSLLEQ